MTFLFPVENADQKVFVAFAVTFAFVPFIMVCLRVMARRIANRRLNSSDWLMIAACALLVIYQGVNISAVIVGGLGIHVEEIVHRFGVASGQETFIKHLLAMQCLWCTDLVLAKLAILVLYVKVFELQGFVLIAKVTGVVIVLWAITMIVGSALICQPISFYWDQSTPGGHCADFYGLWLATGVLNIITDLVVLLLPMPHLYGLSMAAYKKFVLMATFGTGLLTCVISAIRLWALLRFQASDATYSTIPSALLSQLEPSLLITLGCVPLLRPLLGKNYSSRGTARLRSSTFRGTPASDSGMGKGPQQRFRKLAPAFADDTLLQTTASLTQLRPDTAAYSAQVDHESVRGPGSESRLGEDVELGSITVTKTWKVNDGEGKGGVNKRDTI